MAYSGTIIVTNFPCYGTAIVNPVFKADLGIGTYGIDLEGVWHNCDHNVKGADYSCYTPETQVAYLKLKEHIKEILGSGWYNIYGRRYELWEEDGKVLMRHCRGDAKDRLDKLKEKHDHKNMTLDFNSFLPNHAEAKDTVHDI